MRSTIESMLQLSEPITIRLIRNDTDYEAALEEIDGLMGTVTFGTPEYDRLDLLADLVQAYEKEKWPIEKPDPIAMIEFVLEARGLTRKDLEPYIGSRQRVWDIMHKKRRLSLAMMRKLEKGLGIPANILIQEYALVK